MMDKIPLIELLGKAAMNWFQRLFAKRENSTAGRFGKITFDSEVVVYHHPEGDAQNIRWDELNEVGIVTTDEGPVAEDVFFMLLSEDRKKGCAIPQSAEGNEALLSRLQDLPGFNNEVLIEAMGCTSNRNFRLWKKKDEEA